MHRLTSILLIIGCSSKNSPSSVTNTATHDTGGADSGEVPDMEVIGEPVGLLGTEGPACESPDDRSAIPFEIAVERGDWGDQFTPWVDATAGRGWGLAVADFNGDGHLDVFLPNLGTDELFLNDETGTLRRIEGAIPESTRFDLDVDTNGVAATDIDGDGDVDLYLANRGPDRLLLNNGDASFEDISLDCGITEEDLDSISASWGHLDDDGLPDLFVSTYFMGIFPYEDLAAGLIPEGDPNKLYRNLGGGRFEDISHTLPDSTQATFAFAAGWHDVDLDGRSDLMVVNDLGPIVSPNQVLRNTGGALEDWADSSALDVSIYGMGLGVGDINADGAPDFLFSSWDDLIWMESDGEGDWFENSINRGLVSGWTDQNVGWGAEVMDLDNDGNLDVTVPFGAHLMDPIEQAYFETAIGLYNPDTQDNMVFQSTGQSFVEVSRDWGLNDGAKSRVLLPADINGDGWLDLIGRSLDEPARLHLARCGDANWLTISVHDTAPNTLGLGVKVEVISSVKTQVQTVTSGSTGIASSGPHRLHFGLGSAPSVDVRVHWLDGYTTTVTNVVADQHLEIRRL